MGSSGKKPGICAAVGCKNSAKKGFTMKPFPKDAVRKQQWLMKMKRPRWRPAESAVLCEVHFEPSMWEKTNGKKNLKKDAVPTIFSFQRNRRKRKYKDDSDSSEEDSDPSDSSDPSYVASDSEPDFSEEEAPRTRTRSSSKKKQKVSSVPSPNNNKKPEETNKKDENTNTANQKPATPPPSQKTTEIIDKVYNPFSQQKQPVNTHPVHPDVRFCRLPFYDTLAELLKPSTLKPQNLNVNEENFHFYLTPQQARDVINSRVVKQDGLCEFGKQVQLRFCLSETICEQEDYFPKGLMVQINRRLFPLPNPIPTNKPDQEPKRPSKALNITPLIKLSATTANTITVIWTADPGPGYAVTVTLVKRLTSQDLLERLRKKGVMHSDHTRGLIKEKLNEEDAEIMTTHLRVSLMCPLGKMRMKHPCRATTCKHLQCFDAHIYLQMNERKPTWNCPVCDKPALFENLVIDGYFQEVLNSTYLPSSINEIELNKDGSWNIQSMTKETKNNVSLDDTIEIIGDDGDDIPTTQSVQPTSTTKDTVDIVISDSDTDDGTTNRPSSVINLDSSPQSSEDGDDPILDPASGNLIPNPKANKKSTTTSYSNISDVNESNTSTSDSLATTVESLNAVPLETDQQQQQQQQQSQPPILDALDDGFDVSLSEPPTDNALEFQTFASNFIKDVEKRLSDAGTSNNVTTEILNPPELEGPFPDLLNQTTDFIDNDNMSSSFSMPDLESDNIVTTTTTTSSEENNKNDQLSNNNIMRNGDSTVDSSNINV